MLDNSFPKPFLSASQTMKATTTEVPEEETKDGNNDAIELSKHEKRAVLSYPMLKRRSSKQTFDDNYIIKEMGNNTNTKEKLSQYFSNTGLAITRKTLSRLRIRILPNRKLCFAGKVPRGVYMPKNYWLQYLIIKRLIFWYFPCIRHQGASYHLNDKCYKMREIKFLKMFLKTQQLLFQAQAQ